MDLKRAKAEIVKLLIEEALPLIRTFVPSKEMSVGNIIVSIRDENDFTEMSKGADLVLAFIKHIKKDKFNKLNESLNKIKQAHLSYLKENQTSVQSSSSFSSQISQIELYNKAVVRILEAIDELLRSEEVDPASERYKLVIEIRNKIAKVKHNFPTVYRLAQSIENYFCNDELHEYQASMGQTVFNYKENLNALVKRSSNSVLDNAVLTIKIDSATSPNQSFSTSFSASKSELESPQVTLGIFAHDVRTGKDVVFYQAKQEFPGPG